MPTEEAVYVADLNPSLPRGTELRSEGDDHMRMIKSVLQNTFPDYTPEKGAVLIEDVALLIEAIESNRFWKTGMVIPYHAQTIPAGWVLCDSAGAANYGAPNLENRFILGSPDTKPAGVTGGDMSYNIINESTEEEQLTVNHIPKHSHLYKSLAHKDDAGQGSPKQNVGSTGNASYAINVVSSEYGDSEPHSHDFRYTGLNENIPEYYAITFIYKL
jgi:hypothetical protein